MKTEIKKLFKIIQENLECGSGLTDKAIDEATDKILSLFEKEAEKLERVREYCNEQQEEWNYTVKNNSNPEMFGKCRSNIFLDILSILNEPAEEFDVRKWLEGKGANFVMYEDLHKYSFFEGKGKPVEIHLYTDKTMSIYVYSKPVLVNCIVPHSLSFWNQLLKSLGVEITYKPDNQFTKFYEEARKVK